MKNRSVTTLYFAAILAGVPILFVLLTTMTRSFFAEVTWEDGLVNWIDHMFEFPVELDPKDARNWEERILAGGSRKWLVDLSTLPFLVWLARFVGGSLEEIRYTHDISSLKGIEIISRWFGIATLLLLCAPTLAATFFQVFRFFQIWEPIAYLFSFGLMFFLWFWCWRYPDRRIKHVLKVYHFEALKR